MPIEQLLAEPAIPGHAQIAATSPDEVVAQLNEAGASLSVSSTQIAASPDLNSGDLTDRAAALRRRAAGMTGAVVDHGRLSDRADALRDRAEALSTQTP